MGKVTALRNQAKPHVQKQPVPLCPLSYPSKTPLTSEQLDSQCHPPPPRRLPPTCLPVKTPCFSLFRSPFFGPALLHLLPLTLLPTVPPKRLSLGCPRPHPFPMRNSPGFSKHWP